MKLGVIDHHPDQSRGLGKSQHIDQSHKSSEGFSSLFSVAQHDMPEESSLSQRDQRPQEDHAVYERDMHDPVSDPNQPLDTGYEQAAGSVMQQPQDIRQSQAAQDSGQQAKPVERSNQAQETAKRAEGQQVAEKGAMARDKSLTEGADQAKRANAKDRVDQRVILPDQLRQVHALKGHVKGAEAITSQLASQGATASKGGAGVPFVNLLAQQDSQIARLNKAQHMIQVKTSLSSPQFVSQVNEKISWMTNLNQQHALIRLDPPELGQIIVKVQVNQDQAMVSFQSANQDVRQALADHAQKLRDLMGERGLNLANLDVSDQSQEQLNDQGSSGGSGDGEWGISDEDALNEGVILHPWGGLGRYRFHYQV